MRPIPDGPAAFAPGLLAVALVAAILAPAFPAQAAPADDEAAEQSPEAVAELTADLPGDVVETAQAGAGSPEIEIRRAAGEIVVDGRLDDAGWRGAARIDTWFETNPGDNVAPKVANIGYLTYDDGFFYAAFELSDPDPGRTVAPLSERDNVPSSTDYAGVLIDASNDGKTAQMFLANPRGVQYDAISSDYSGEDSAPDFFWDSAARVTETGWTLEVRIPFSTLRYREQNPESWGILLYRNYPRDFRYQMFSARLPRDRGCFICNSNPLRGLENLPQNGGWVVAPFATAGQSSAPRDGLGSPLASADPDSELGLDVKWMPGPDTVIDGTVNPDFSQVESDAPQISTNERFALFFPEKRPFFLEGVDLFSTPIDAVYTRSFTSPKWGARATGTAGKVTYTALVGQDRGGGGVIIPGSQRSDFAPQDFESTVAISRMRMDLGESFVSFLVSDREVEGGAYNRVVGPDFRWRPTDQDTVAGQALWAMTKTPDRPDLASEWDGRDLEGHAAKLWWYHGTETVDWFAEVMELDDEFRADNGFVPQVGFRHVFGELGYTFRPEDKPINRVRVFTWAGHDEDLAGDLLWEEVTAGIAANGKRSSFARMSYGVGEVRAGAETFDRQRLFYIFEVSPTRAIGDLRLDGFFGDDVDFGFQRPGSGGRISLGGTVRAGDRLQLRLDGTRRWLDVEEGSALSPAAGLGTGRLFTADIARMRATYSFSSRMYVRLITEYVATERNPELYPVEVRVDSGALSGSALFAYKLNWQTVLFLGYATQQSVLEELRDDNTRNSRYEPAGERVFLKVSYAFQG